MKIAILSTIEPFIMGGAKKQFENLYSILKENQNQVELFLIPFNFNIEKLNEQIEGIRKIHINSDIIITSRPMSYVIKHPNKILWFMHHISYFYEFSETPINPYLNHPNFKEKQQKFLEQDTLFIKESKKIFTVSNFVSQKLKKYNNVESQTVYPPLNDTHKFYFNKYSDYFFLPSLITFTKRQHLIIEGLLYTRNPVKLILAGQIDKKYYLKYIAPLIKHKKIKQNLIIIDNYINNEKYDYYANSLGTIFTPINEAFGYVVLESFFSSKPVITTNDSGGPCELITNNTTGFVTEPHPQNIAQIMDTLYENRKYAEKLGKNAYEFAKSNFETHKIKKTIKELFFY
ncbi:MAG: glycosyltransferase family 4 protein [bacterium]|nr:glycosyltransferase family 4 protein [bacterium]